MQNLASGPRLRRVLGQLSLWLVLSAVAGCGSSQAKVSGKVLLNGSPLPGGLISFRPTDPQHSPVGADIGEDGTYEVVLPVGEVEVSIDNRALEPLPPGPTSLPPGILPELSPQARKELKMKSPAPAAAQNAQHGRYVEIPERYYDPETSQLTFRVERNGQQHDFQLAK